MAVMKIIVPRLTRNDVDLIQLEGRMKTIYTHNTPQAEGIKAKNESCCVERAALLLTHGRAS